MVKYKKDMINLFGSIEKDGIRLLVPYHSFVNEKEQHCRIPIEIYEKYMKQGFSKDEILTRHADWYAKSNFDYRKQYYANIVARNEAERIRNQETGLSDKELIEGYLEKWKETNK